MDAARGLCGAGGRAAQEEVIRRAGPRSRACWQEGRAARVRPLPRTSTLMVHEAWCVSAHVSTPPCPAAHDTGRELRRLRILQHMLHGQWFLLYIFSPCYRVRNKRKAAEAQPLRRLQRLTRLLLSSGLLRVAGWSPCRAWFILTAPSAAALAPLSRCPTRRPHRQHRRSGDHDRRPKSHHHRGRSRLLGHFRSAWWTMGFSAASAVARMAPCVRQGTALRY